MRGVKRTSPIYMTCTRPGCGVKREVRRPVDQQKRRFCSRRCAALVTRNIAKSHLGFLVAAARRRERVIAQIVGMTPLESFRFGYHKGLNSKLTTIRRNYVLTKRAEVGA